MRRHNFTFAAILMATIASGGCTQDIDDGDDDGASSASELASGTVIDRSLAVTNPEILAKFSFSRTIEALRRTALEPGQALAGTESSTAVFQRWMKTFGTAAGGNKGCNSPGVDPNKYGLDCPRAPELKLAAADPFAAATFKPVALFNRFDLMPASGAHCGEHRIVYAMNSGSLPGRAFIIFEAVLPNPKPAEGAKGCLPIAQFWQGLSKDGSVTSRAAKLEKLYFTGGAVPGVPPVVSARHYGLVRADGSSAMPGRIGQIRTNFFIDFAEWHLREFKLRARCPTASTCRLEFDHVTVKTNPAEELFAGTHAKSAEFRTSFKRQVASLARGNVTSIGMSIGDGFNEFESVSQDSKVLYSAVANDAVKADIQAELTRLGSTLTATNILDRATTQTCAGCHQISNAANLGGGLRWPASQGFVQIDEQGQMAPALRDVFLPRRKVVLEAFINKHTGAKVAAGASLGEGPDETISGVSVGSAN